MTTTPPTQRAAQASRMVVKFLSTEAGGALILLGAVVAALIWANSLWSEAYESLLHADLSVAWLDWDLHEWVNDGLMALFFFMVGLEISREMQSGELSNPRTAAVPTVAAVGGMIVPAAIYLAFNAGGPGSSGWGIPMATDIAFAVGLLAALGSRAPLGLRLFLLTLAIVDDIGAITVIAIFYTSDLNLWALVGALVVLAAVLGIRLLHRRRGWAPLVFVLGVGAWAAMTASGVHPTIAGVFMGLILAPAEHLEERLLPWVTFGVIPVFALANAGVELSGDALSGAFGSPVTWGIILGLVLGKLLGVWGTSLLTVRVGLGVLPSQVTRSRLAGVATIAGIGFTVALFIAELAFDDPALVEEAKVGILVASALAAVLGAALIVFSAHRPSAARANAEAAAAEQARIAEASATDDEGGETSSA